MTYLSLQEILKPVAPGQSAMAAFRRAIQQLPDATVVTLDLAQTEDFYFESEIVDIVRVMHEMWPQPAFCLARCHDPRTWRYAAVGVGQPLLAWRAFSQQGGCDFFGRSMSGTARVLFDALYQRYDRATAGQLARDPRITPPDQMAYDEYSLLEFARTGVYPIGATRTDEVRIANELHRMVQQHLILQVAPGWYSVALPTPPLQ